MTKTIVNEIVRIAEIRMLCSTLAVMAFTLRGNNESVQESLRALGYVVTVTYDRIGETLALRADFTLPCGELFSLWMLADETTKERETNLRVLANTFTKQLDNVQ